MKSLITVLVFVGLIVIGCSRALQQTEFRREKIFVGQSNDSIEKHLGAPDYAKNYALGVILLGQMVEPFGDAFGVRPGMVTREWVYIDQDNSLIVWMDSGNVGAIWLVKTKEIESMGQLFDSNYGRKMVNQALVRRQPK